MTRGVSFADIVRHDPDVIPESLRLLMDQVASIHTERSPLGGSRWVVVWKGNEGTL